MAPPKGNDKDDTEQTSLLKPKRLDHPDQDFYFADAGATQDDDDSTRNGATAHEYQAVVFGSMGQLADDDDDAAPPPPPPPPPQPAKTSSSFCCPKFDRDAIHFGVRLSLLLTLSSLFVVIRDVANEWPEGQWVVITVLFVSWFPRLDAASVIEKSIQRIMGTLLGGFMGLVCGSLSLHMPDATGPHGARNQAICIEICFALVTFLFCFLSAQLKVGKTGARIVDRYNYATILCNLTFIIALFPFYRYESHDPWRTSQFRVLNVAIGCFLSAIGAMVVLPRSANDLLHKRIQKQCSLAGEASEAVLHAASDEFLKTSMPSSSSSSSSSTQQQSQPSPHHHKRKHRRNESRTSFRRLNQAILDEGRNIALEKYEVAIKNWKATKSLFSLLQYDPFQYLSRQSQEFLSRRAEFRSTCADVLSRALEIQTAVILMDGIVRNEPPHGFDEDAAALFAEIGTLTRKLFQIVPSKDVTASAMVKEELMELLNSVHQLILQMTVSVAAGTPLQAMTVTRAANRRSALRSSLLFLELVEHLTLHCLSLYDHWMVVERVAEDSPNLTRVVSFSQFSA
jgi:hypothetical protein